MTQLLKTLENEQKQPVYREEEWYQWFFKWLLALGKDTDLCHVKKPKFWEKTCFTGLKD